MISDDREGHVEVDIGYPIEWLSFLLFVSSFSLRLSLRVPTSFDFALIELKGVPLVVENLLELLNLGTHSPHRYLHCRFLQRVRIGDGWV